MALLLNGLRRKLLAAGAVALVVAVLGGALYIREMQIRSLRAELSEAQSTAETLRASNAAYAASLKAMESEIAKRDTLLAERDQRINDINARRAADRRTWQEALRNDQTVRDWNAVPLPDAVRGLFRE